MLTYLDADRLRDEHDGAGHAGGHDKTLVTVPLYHIAGATAMMSSIWGGRTLVLLPQFEPELWLEDGAGREGHAQPSSCRRC